MIFFVDAYSKYRTVQDIIMQKYSVNKHTYLKYIGNVQNFI